MEYCLDYANVGSVPIANYQISDPIDPNSSYFSVGDNNTAPIPGSYDAATQVLTYSWGATPLNVDDKGSACFTVIIGKQVKIRE